MGDALDPGRATRIQTLEDLVPFLRDLAANENDPSWQNPDTAGYLEAMAAYIENRFNPDAMIPVARPELSWATFAELLAAATVYE